MKLLSKSSIAKLRQGEIIQLSKNTTYVYRKAETVNVRLMNRIDALSNATAGLDGIYKNAPAHKLSSGVKSIDEKRISILRGIKLYIKSQTKIYSEEEKAAADILLESYDTHVDTPQKLSLQEKTAVIEALANDWRNDSDLVAAVEKLSMTGMIDRLVAINQQFDTNYINRAVTKAPNTNSEEKKDKIIAAFIDLYNDTISLSRVAEDANVYTAILQEVDGLIEFHKTPAKMRASFRKKDKESTESTDGTTDML